MHFLDSTSTWDQRHIIAFRMLDYNDLLLDHIYPIARATLPATPPVGQRLNFNPD